MAIGKNVEGIPVDVTDGIDQADKYISRLCKRIEAGSNVNQAKVLSEIRSHQDLSANIIAILQKVSIK